MAQGWAPTFLHAGLHMDLFQHMASTCICVGLIALLFSGHICTAVALQWARAGAPPSLFAVLKELLPLQEVQDPSQRHIVLRNYAFAPLAEEIVFRGIVWVWLSSAQVPPHSAILWGPSLFAIGTCVQRKRQCHTAMRNP